MIEFDSAYHTFSLRLSRHWHVGFAPGWFRDGDLYFAGFLQIEVYPKTLCKEFDLRLPNT